MPLATILYGTALITLLIGVVIACLQVIEFDNDASDFDLVMMFLFVLMNTGLIYGGIIAGFGALVSLLKPSFVRYYCTNCDNDVLDKWIVCPYCGDTLEECE